MIARKWTPFKWNDAEKFLRIVFSQLSNLKGNQIASGLKSRQHQSFFQGEGNRLKW